MSKDKESGSPMSEPELIWMLYGEVKVAYDCSPLKNIQRMTHISQIVVEPKDVSLLAFESEIR